MKKETGVLIAGAVGLITAVGLFVLKKILSNKEYYSEYSDYHQHFTPQSKKKNEDHHGVEYLSMM